MKAAAGMRRKFNDEPNPNRPKRFANASEKGQCSHLSEATVKSRQHLTLTNAAGQIFWKNKSKTRNVISFSPFLGPTHKLLESTD
jgi:hypothetical protein